MISAWGEVVQKLKDSYKQDLTITQAVGDQMIDEALSKDLRRVNASGGYKSEKLTLSLVHQANVVLVMPADEVTQEVVM